jgi:hypothetical protein
VGDLFYKTQSVVKYETHKILCFQGRTGIPDPISKLIVQSFAILGGRTLIIKERDQFWEWVTLLSYSMLLDLGEGTQSIAWSHPRRPLLLVKRSRQGGPKEEKDPLYEYHLVEPSPLHDNAEASRCVLVESKTRRYMRFTSWTDNLLLFGETCDTNGDGTVDHHDDCNESVHVLDLRTGKVSPVLPALANRTGLGGHPSGRYVYSLEEIAKNEKYVLRILDTRATTTTDLAVLRDGKYLSCEFDSAFRFAVCQRVGDTTGRKKFYSWEDRSSIYRIDLPTLD